MKLQFNLLNPRIKLLIFSILVILLTKSSSYLSLLLPWYFGFLVLSNKDFDLIEKVAIAPAIGLGIIIILIHILSWLDAPLGYSYTIIAISTVILSKREIKVNLKELDKITIIWLIFAVFLAVGLKIPFAQIPAYAHKDPVFHAYKVLEILKENTLFIQNIPNYANPRIKTYPAGYHSIIAWICLVGRNNIGQAMLILKLFIWFILPLATYLVTKNIFNKNAGIFAAIVTPLSYLYYYYLNYPLLPAFFNYYLFLVSIFLYNLIFQNGRSYNHAFLILLSVTSMLIVHPYSYLLFQIYAIMLAFLYTFMERKSASFYIGIFVTQLLGSFLIYYLLEFPMSINMSIYSAPIFNFPKYALKDNMQWFLEILKDTFIYNGQLFLGISFFVGILYPLAKENNNSSSLPYFSLLTTIIYALFLILNKIYFHVNIPYYSAIWNSERVYLLLTPILPIFQGIGVFIIYKNVKKIIGIKKVTSILIIGLVLPMFYVNIINYSNEKASVVDSKILNIFDSINTYPTNKVLVTKFHDSGAWIPIFTLKEIEFVDGKNVTTTDALLYIDSRGIGDLRVSPLNPLNFLGKYKLIYFESNIWIYDLSMNWSKTDQYLINKVISHFKLPKNAIIATDFEDWKYLIYGFVLKNPVVIREVLLHKWSYALVPSGEGYIVFVPTKSYNKITLKVLLAEQNQTIQITINGNVIGEITQETQNFEYSFKPNTLYIIKLKSNKPFGFVNIILKD